MRIIFCSLFAVLLCAGCASVMPEVDPAYKPDIQLKDLAGKMRDAVDPNGIYRKSSSYYLKQDIKMSGKVVSIEVTFKSPNRSKTVIMVDGKTVQTTLCNGTKCWKVDKEGGKTEVTGGDLDRIKLFDALSAPSGTILDVFETIEFAGEQVVVDSPCYILLCHSKAKDVEPIALFVSKKDFLNRKIITTRGGQPYMAEIRKYSLLKGVMIATETEIDIDNDGEKDLMTVTDYRLDIDIPDSFFEVK